MLPERRARRTPEPLYHGHMNPSGQSGQRVAFFGGSFDPPHRGHLAVARAARAALKLDTVLFAPVGAQPLKPYGAGAAFADRLEMTRLAIDEEPGFSLSLADAPRPAGEPNYTLETLLRLRSALAEGGELFCLMGADSYFGLRGWHRAGEIPFAAPLIVASRPGEKMDELKSAMPAGLRVEGAGEAAEPAADAAMRRFVVVNRAGERAPLYLLPGLHVEISASTIRESMKDTRGPSAVEELLPSAVAAYIRARGLYGWKA